MHGLWSAARYEIRALLRDPSILLASIVVPLFWCLILALTLGPGLMRGLPVAWVDLDHSSGSREIARLVDAAPSMSLKAYPSPAAAEEALRRGEVYAVFSIPDDWEKDMRSGKGSTIAAAYNRVYYPVSTILEVDLKSALADFALASGAQKRTAAAAGGSLQDNAGMLRALVPETYFLGNPAFNFSAYLIAPVLPGVLALGAVLAFAGSLVREWRENSVRQWLEAADGSPLKAILGKLLPWLLAYAVIHSAWVVAFAACSGWSPAGSIFFWLTAGWLLMLAMAGLALLVTSISMSWVLSITTISALCAPAFPFTGFSYPIDAMTPGAAFIAELLPLTHYLRAQAEAWILNSPVDQMLRTQGVLMLFAAVTFAAGLPIWAHRLCGFARREALQLRGHPDTLPAGAALPDAGFVTMTGSALRQMIFNRDAAAVFLGAAALYLAYYGWPYQNEQIEHIPTAVVDLDRSAASRELIRALDAAPAVDLMILTPDPGEAENAFRRQQADVVVTIPERYAERLALGENLTIPVLGNGAYPVKARAVQGALSAILTSGDIKYAEPALTEVGTDPTRTWSAHAGAPALVSINRFNTISGYATYIVPIVAPLIIQAIVTIGVVLTVGQWMRRRDPIAEQAARRPTAALALWSAVFLTALFWNLYAQGADFFWWEFTGFANPCGTLLLLVAYSAAIASFALGITALWGRADTAAPAVIVMSAPILFASGGIWPDPLITHPFVNAVRAVIPTTPAIPALAALSQSGAQTQAAAMPAVVLALQTLFWGAAALWAARRHLK